ncbi:hypothetical protein ACFOST_17850 [Cytobacillus kochii]|uniref:hypothetical protein n=1 Tax=Cytobacillus kochii TaxID=859143 RepID=UPI00278A916A|nr:hypothetical protein [Cytobacillus kochii]MDQ0186940.1 hypothetical protein [Cytobacillus kochii]
MFFEEYKEFLIQTTNEVYPKYIQNHILKGLEKEHIVNDDGNLSLFDDSMDISEVPEEEKLAASIQHRTEAIKFIEEWEFNKHYKYSVIFRYDNLDMDKINEGIEKNDIANFSTSGELFDQLVSTKRNGFGELEFAKGAIPTFYETDEFIFLKFSIKYHFNNFQNGHVTKLKYPILVVFFKELNIFEIRFDKIKNSYKDKDTLYVDNISMVHGWLRSKLGLNIIIVNLEPRIESICRDANNDVVVHSQCMSLRTGGKATLEVGGNTDNLLPILGELKELMNRNKILFEESKEIKDLLEDFISDTEETADLPWIALRWTNQIKAKEIIVKFQHRYMGTNYSLLQYFGSQTQVERMNYVTKYLIEN